MDSGASATVVGESEVRAVKAANADPNRHYKMADGSIIPHKGEKRFWALTEDEQPVSLTTQVADVDKALLSVAQVVHNGARVVFSQQESYVEYPGGRKDHLMERDGLYVMKLWVPKNQAMPFPGQA